MIEYNDSSTVPIIDVSSTTYSDPPRLPLSPAPPQGATGGHLQQPLDNELVFPNPFSTTISYDNMTTVPLNSTPIVATEEPDCLQGKPNPSADQIPSAPPIDKMDKVIGYETVTFYVAPLPPPATDPNTRGHPPTRTSFSSYPALTEEQGRSALIQHVSQNCCFGKGAAQEMIFRSIENSSAFHYTLETFGEKRETAWVYEPYIGQPIDSPNAGLAPGPWDIGVTVGPLFKENRIQVEVPHTANVKPCHECASVGRRRCATCWGDGQMECSSCNGTGRSKLRPVLDNDQQDGRFHRDSRDPNECGFCHGRGKRKCGTCHGHGQTKCLTCDGQGQLKCFIQLTVVWKNHIDDYIVERSSLPDELIGTVSGQLAFEEEQPWVWPVNHFPDDAVNRASAELIRQHVNNYNLEKIVRQRHRVRIVPVSQIHYSWKGKDDNFFVYGFEHKVFAPNYPQKCCCGCSIL